jgi:hypothetical protein
LGGDAGADPADYRDGEGVSGALILRAVGGLALGLALPRDVSVVIGEALESEALVGGKAANRHRPYQRNIATACPETADDRRGHIQGAGDAAVVRVVFVDLLLNHRVGRAGVADVEVVERVRLLALDPAFVVGLGLRPLGLAEGYCSEAFFSAASSIGGNALPLFPARRKMPLHAFAER